MDIIRIAKEALSTAWNHKYLWLFGFFVAGASGGGGGQGGAPTAGGAGVVPDWVFLLLAGGAVLGLVALTMYIISEGALIEGVVKVREGEEFSIRAGFRSGLSHFWRVLGVIGGAACGWLLPPELVTRGSAMNAMGRRLGWVSAAIVAGSFILCLMWAGSAQVT